MHCRDRPVGVRSSHRERNAAHLVLGGLDVARVAAAASSRRHVAREDVRLSVVAVAAVSLGVDEAEVVGQVVALVLGGRVLCLACSTGQLGFGRVSSRRERWRQHSRSGAPPREPPAAVVLPSMSDSLVDPLAAGAELAVLVLVVAEAADMLESR